jgi:two-component system response regulator LytT
MQSGGNVIKLGEAVDTRLAELQRNRIPAMFFRANRQYILNIDSIHKVENWFNGKLIVKTKPDAQERIVVSRESAKGFKEWINQ